MTAEELCAVLTEEEYRLCEQAYVMKSAWDEYESEATANVLMKRAQMSTATSLHQEPKPSSGIGARPCKQGRAQEARCPGLTTTDCMDGLDGQWLTATGTMQSDRGHRPARWRWISFRHTAFADGRLQHAYHESTAPRTTAAG